MWNGVELTPNIIGEWKLDLNMMQSHLPCSQIFYCCCAGVNKHYGGPDFTVEGRNSVLFYHQALWHLEELVMVNTAAFNQFYLSQAKPSTVELLEDLDKVVFMGFCRFCSADLPISITG